MSKKRSVNGGYDFRLYVNCPECGRLILRSENTDNSEIPCPKCGAKVKVNVSIEDETVTTMVIKPSKRRMAALSEYSRRISGAFKTN